MRALLVLAVCLATTGCAAVVSYKFPGGGWDAKAGWMSIYAPVDEHPHPDGGPDGLVKA